MFLKGIITYKGLNFIISKDAVSRLKRTIIAKYKRFVDITYLLIEYNSDKTIGDDEYLDYISDNNLLYIIKLPYKEL